MDRRTTPATSRIAHVSMQGRTDLPLTKGEPMQVSVALTDLLSGPSGHRERQLAMGEGFTVIEVDGTHAFGFSTRDGYCGYVKLVNLEPDIAPSHWLAFPATHLYPEPNLKSREIESLTMGARLRVLEDHGDWAETTKGFVWKQHLRPVGEWMADPVAVAERFLGTPYLWGGNSRAGIDCSGLAQISQLACGRDCPGDSDLQQAVGRDAKGSPKRGDMLFWKGHVALAMDARRIIHATAAFMSVVVEETSAAIARIEASGGGPLIAHRRP